jgi:hypothetical protein
MIAKRIPLGIPGLLTLLGPCSREPVVAGCDVVNEPIVPDSTQTNGTSPGSQASS